MNQKIYNLLLFLVVWGFQLNAQTTVTIKDGDLAGGQTYTWTKNNVYLLDGFVFLEDGGRLNIEAGTVIKGKESPTTGDNASALIIARGAQIFAQGASREPVIFTAEIDDVNDPDDLNETDRGLWGGLLILGRASIADNTTEVGIEGIPAGEARALYGAPTAAQFNDADNSGVLRYVSIRHGGAEIGAGNEINGLTLGGVGNGTTIEYVEVFANFDDGIEFFGGTVSVKYASVAFCGDDAFDWDTGYRGKGQFWFSLQAADAGDNGGELDGAIPDANTPFSQPTIFNATFIGSGPTAPAPNEHALLFRDGTGGLFGNSIFTSFRNYAIQVEDLPAASGVDSRQRMENGQLVLSNNIWWEFGRGADLNAGPTGIIRATPNAEDPNAQFLITHLTSNGNTLENPQLGGIARTATGALDPRPAGNGPAYQNPGAYPNDPFYTPVSYKGAFGSSIWQRGWTALDEYGYLAPAQEIVIKDEDLVGGQTYTWTKGNTYLIDGFVFLEEGGVLNIEPGVIIKGKESPTTGDNASALIIARGARIFAEGMAEMPIIFTAEIDDVNDPDDLNETDRGLWGGLLILGRASIADNTTEVGIEGIPAGEARALYGAPTAAQFNDADNSGVLRYVSIRHGGAEIGAGNEINGLTLGGVGSGTTIEYVEVFANFDDGIEFFGGTVNVKYAVVAFCGDDSYDWDTGYRGKGQFWFSLQAADAGDNGGELDGAIPDANTPFSQPNVFNATFIGAGPNGQAPNEHALLFRDGTGGYFSNSIITSFRNYAIQVEDLPAASGVDSRQRLANGELALRNNIWWEFGRGADLNAGPTGIIRATPNAEDPNAQFLITHLTNNGNTLENPQLGGISRTAGGGALDPRPAVSGPAYQNLGAYPNDPFYTPVQFKGAFCNDGVWFKGWTAVSEYGVLAALVPAAAGTCDAQITENIITIKDPDLVGGQTYTWTKGNTYLIDGFVFLEEGGVLNIEPGVIIKGKESPTTGDNASALIIARGAQIFAEGMAEMPIIFTAEIDDVNNPADLNETDRGLWGGLLILGRASIADNTTEVGIEGIPAGEARALYGAPTAAQFNDADNSGVLRYVSIRHGGAEIGAGNEINGLTLGGVGSGTTIDHVEVFANFDDGIEFFGGTVNVKYASVAFCGDDSYDWDTGYRGKGQFWFSLQAADAGDNGGELDGAIPDANLPFSQPNVFNATFIGAGPNGQAPNEHALLFRDGTGGYFSNSIITSFRNYAIQVEDLPAASGVDSRQRLANGELALRNNIWWEFGRGADLNAGPTGIIRATPNAEDPNAQFLIDHLTGNGNTLEDPQLGGIARTATGGLDPRPSLSGPAYAGLAAYTNDPFYTPVRFKGAFCGQGVWLKSWTALDAYGYLNASVPGATDNCDFATSIVDLASESNGFVLAQSAPNPAADRMMIEFELPKTSTVTLTIFDLSGRQLSRVIDNTGFITGKHQVEVNTANLSNGVYVYALQTESVVLTRKFVVKR